jgi:hypothetical protein
MKDGWIILIFFVVWIVGSRYVLPKLGIPT